MLRALALLLLAPLLGAANSEARGEDLTATLAQQALDRQGFPSANADGPTHLPRLAGDMAFYAGYGRRKLAIEIPFPGNGTSYSLCLLYDYARTDQVDPISGTGFATRGSSDAHNLGLGLRGLMTERLEFEAVMGHSHTDSSSNSAYAGLIYDVDGHLGFGADLGRINAAGQSNNRLRAFARFYF